MKISYNVYRYSWENLASYLVWVIEQLFGWRTVACFVFGGCWTSWNEADKSHRVTAGETGLAGCKFVASFFLSFSLRRLVVSLAIQRIQYHLSDMTNRTYAKLYPVRPAGPFLRHLDASWHSSACHRLLPAARETLVPAKKDIPC